MNKKTTVGMCLLAAGLLAGFAFASENVALVEEGVAKCRVVVAADASKPEKFGAAELAKYLGKATGCGALDGAYPIRISVKPLPELKEDGFVLDVRADGLDIVGANPRGALYGCYEILKRYAGMRWLVPGDDGEYCVLGSGKSGEGGGSGVGGGSGGSGGSAKGTIVVPVGREAQNPVHVVRKINGWAVEPEFYKWLVRNNMYGTVDRHRYVRDGKVTAPWLEELTVNGVGPGGHVLSSALIGTNKVEELFAAHPEYFPLVNGKRTLIKGANDPNPCVSNPAVLDRIADYVHRASKPPHGSDEPIILGDNDTTSWCECERCRAIDDPATAGTRGARSNRFWYMVGEVAKRVWAKDPSVKLGGWAYQDFWYPPTTVKIDPRLAVLVSYNNQCWRHSVADPDCPVNAEMAKIYRAWKKLGLPRVANRDEISDGAGPGMGYTPSERIVAQNMRDYLDIGCNGSQFFLYGPFPETLYFAKDWRFFHGKNLYWHSMWRVCWISSKFLWDPLGSDYEALYEECNSLYYGAAWEGGMKEFRALLQDCFYSTPGCIGWGQGTTVGRCLDKPGSEDKLVALLERAAASAKAEEAKAKAKGEEGRIRDAARALKHVLRDKEIFELTWLAERKTYVENYREMTAYKRTGEIVVDGVLDEKDWQTADSYSNFAVAPWQRKKGAKCERTYLKVAYDRDHLYFAVEAMEPAMDRIVAGKKVDRVDGYSETGNRLEMFYAFPDMAQAEWHLVVNSEGQMMDALQKSTTVRDTSRPTQAKWAVKKLADRWTLEMAIPCSEIGQNILDGMTWKVNCARCRKLRDVEETQISSAANGNIHGTENFVNVKFVPVRQGTGAHDAAAWKNGGFDALEVNDARHPNFRWKRWKSEKTAVGWSSNAVGETKEHPEAKGNHYLSFTDGDVVQYYEPFAAGNNRIRFRARGTGKVSMLLYNYTKHPDPNAGGLLQLREYPAEGPVFELTPEWKAYSVERKSLGVADEKMVVRFTADKASTVELDDVVVSPCE